jgi:hypothetical protein
MAVTITEEIFRSSPQDPNPVKKIIFDWTSDAAGDATGTTTNAYTGELLRFITVPDGVSAPTALYDVVINDEDSTDALIAAGANRSATVTEQVIASSLGAVANDKLTIVVSNAGNTKKGKAYLYIR